jgi:two-component sensor histidine kinase
MVTGLTGRFVNVSTGNLDHEIESALRLIGEFAGVDRSYVFQFSRDGRRVSNTHEWCAQGITPEIDRVQEAPVESYPFVLNPLRRGEVVYVADVARLPEEAGAFKRELERQHILSVVNVPLQCVGKVLGFVGFDSVRTVKHWGQRHIQLLRVVGEIIAGAIEREKATRILERQVQLETLVAGISTRFINVPVAELDREISSAIGAIGEFTGVDRSYVFQFAAGGETMSNSHEWCAPGIERHIDRLQDLPVAAFSYAMAILESGRVFYVPEVSRLPPEANAEKAEFQKEGIQTLVNVPIMIRGRIEGFLGFDAVRERKLWSEDDHRLLRLVGEIFANALARKRADKKLEASLREKEVLLREIHHRVKNNLQIVDSLLYLQMRSLDDDGSTEARDAFRQSQNRVRAMAQIHEQLYRSQDFSKLAFSDYLAQLLPGLEASYCIGSHVAITICECHVALAIDQAIPCGLIVNELVTNSLKHAFPDGRTGTIHICLEQTGNQSYALSVTDDGVGFASEELWSKHKSLGLRLVKDLVLQLDGTAELATGPSGSRITVRFG